MRLGGEVGQDHPPAEVDERPARRVYVLKCQECGKEYRLSPDDVDKRTVVIV